ncbi:MAG: serine hydrolase [Candidatus Promineifilaceae bacterium]
MPKQRIWVRRITVGCLFLILFSCLSLSIYVIVERQRVSQWAAIGGLIFEAPQYARLQSADHVLNYLDNNPDSFSLVAYSVDVEGDAKLGESHIFHNADRPLPLASTAKIVVLTAYARAIAGGVLDSAETLTLAEWDRYHVPNTNGGAHIAALSDLDIEHDQWGYALDDTQQVTIDQLVNAMIVQSDNAAPEWLIDRLGYEAIQAVVTDLDLDETLRLLPHSGLLLTLQNHEQDELTAEHVDALLAMDRPAFEALVWRNQARFIDETVWGAAARDFWRADESIRDPRLELQAMALLSAQGTTRDFATIMAGVVSERLFSAEISQIMRSHLEWPMEIAGNSAEFQALGNKGGSLLGITTDATYFIPLNGDYAKQPRIVILFMHNIPLSAWLGFNNTFAHQLFGFTIATDASYSEHVRATLKDK